MMIVEKKFRGATGGDDCSDLVEWLFQDYDPTPKISGIEMNQKSLELKVGEITSLSVVPNPSTVDLSKQTITWKSEDESIATVSEEGVVTAVGEGTTKITAKVQEFTAECTINVEKAINLKIEKETIKIPQNQTYKIETTINEEVSNVTKEYFSSNQSVATIDKNGTITARREGTTQITVLAKKQISENSVIEESVTCTVTVSGQLGDVDGDGEITAYDAYKALEISVDYTTGIKSEEEIILKTDVNKSGKPESEDAYQILKYSVGLINEF